MEIDDYIRELYSNHTIKEIVELTGYSDGKVRYSISKQKLNKQKPELFLNNVQEQLIIGSMLGDGNIKCNGKNGSYFRVGNTDIEYVEWKASIMQQHITAAGIVRVEARAPKQKAQYWFSTKTYQTMYTYNELTTLELLDKVNDVGLTIWLLDDGWKSYNHMCIACERFSKEELEYACSILKEKFNISAHVIGTKRKSISISPESNDIVKNIVQSVLPKTTDIVARKVNSLT